ncbi:MAG: DUF933 domain-containing protein [Candidatus Omnitrophica bacterium]|nr:DUF933 domain-containing protein [Candidatus Omnitrophota bacterium]
MKVSNFGLDILPGKYKYIDEYFSKLVKKFSPQKESPYTVEFVDDELEMADAIVFNPIKKLDLILIDLEKLEKRLSRSDNEKERNCLLKAQGFLEKESLLCNNHFTEEEKAILRNLGLVTLKPCIEKDKIDDINSLIKEVIDKTGVLLFFTAGKKEVHAWDIYKGDDIVKAAGRIHSDFARGFIKAEVISCKDLDKFYNLAEAKAKGLVKLVDRDYIVEENDIIEIKFNV